MRHRLGLDDEKSLLLIEHEGVVRAGARLDGTVMHERMTYDAAAFPTIRRLIESCLDAR